MKSLFDYFTHRSPTDSLCDLDQLYAHTISGLPVRAQIGYCRRLIDRSRYDLDRTGKKETAARLEKIIEAAQTEVDGLSSRIGQ
ncbi:MAG TPA: hypothetical protein VFD35_02285 [Pricia sp.]|nr:hypothetical protein [Pricia sp.]